MKCGRVGGKANPRWTWHAIERESGRVLTYAFGSRKEWGLKEFRELLAPFGIVNLSTDDWDAYCRPPLSQNHYVGKRNTQRIKRKHLPWRTASTTGQKNHLRLQVCGDV
nr:IS1 family transposase [Magnetofaba australis]